MNSIQGHNTNMSSDVIEAEETCHTSSSLVQRLMVGLCLMITTAAVCVTGSQLTRATYIKNVFEAPFLIMYFWSAWLILVYPAYVIQRRMKKRRDISTLLELRSHMRLFHNGQNHQILRFLALTLLFCVLWCVTNYTYIRALDPSFLDTSDVIALYSTHFSFVYMLSWIVLFEKFVAVRVLLKKFLDAPDNGRISFFISIVGLCSVVTMWPIALTLCLTKMEIAVMHDIPWHFLCSSAFLMTVLQLLSYYTQDVTIYALFSGLGFALSLPLCTVADILWQNKAQNGMKIAAITVTAVGVLLILLPDQCPEGFFDFNYVNACWFWKRTDIVHIQQEIPPRGRLQRNTRRL